MHQDVFPALAIQPFEDSQQHLFGAAEIPAVRELDHGLRDNRNPRRVAVRSRRLDPMPAHPGESTSARTARTVIVTGYSGSLCSSSSRRSSLAASPQRQAVLAITFPQVSNARSPAENISSKILRA